MLGRKGYLCLESSRAVPVSTITSQESIDSVTTLAVSTGGATILNNNRNARAWPGLQQQLHHRAAALSPFNIILQVKHRLQAQQLAAARDAQARAQGQGE